MASKTNVFKEHPEVRKIFREAVKNLRRLDGCKMHFFKSIPRSAFSLQRCVNCYGVVSKHTAIWYKKGLKDANGGGH